MKDNLSARKNLKIICNRLELEVDERKPNVMFKAIYTLTREQTRRICEWIAHLKFSDGYASNLAHCVNMKELRLHSMKSHDCHVFMQKLTPITFHEMLPKSVWSALTEVICERNRPSRNEDLAMNDTQRHIIKMYILINYEVVMPYYESCLNELYEHYHSEDPIIKVKDEINYTGNKLLKLHYWGPTAGVTTFPCYFVNGYNFQTQRHSVGKLTVNCGVCVKSSSYTDTDSDFYGILEEVI
ncbi:hypothetical protein Sango_2818000 [Sesamum angolense]|uniref:Uncharacterized protein n=1 Tax=Sesamum angolense TaxID=2727404 RepID=A0AAE1T8G0_9LAMI|nr:hypothetical protein Sango_2818000 [Sesamum angolense]